MNFTWSCSFNNCSILSFCASACTLWSTSLEMSVGTNTCCFNSDCNCDFVLVVDCTDVREHMTMNIRRIDSRSNRDFIFVVRTFVIEIVVRIPYTFMYLYVYVQTLSYVLDVFHVAFSKTNPAKTWYMGRGGVSKQIIDLALTIGTKRAITKSRNFLLVPYLFAWLPFMSCFFVWLSFRVHKLTSHEKLETRNWLVYQFEMGFMHNVLCLKPRDFALRGNELEKSISNFRICKTMNSCC
jgi:hypothetical protein